MPSPASPSGKANATRVEGGLDPRASLKGSDADVTPGVNRETDLASHSREQNPHFAGPATKVPSRPPPPNPTNGEDFQRASARTRALKAARLGEAEVDLELVRRAQGGDQAAFRSLVERHQRRAFAIALARVRNEQDARDIVQDAFVRVHKSLPAFQGASSFFTWLYRIVTNLSIDLVRRPGRNTDELDEERHRSSSPGAEPNDPMWVSRIDGSDPVNVLRRKELAARMREAIDALPSYHKAVILMREVEGLSYEEMAVAMDVSKGTIMSRLFHARQKLQKALSDCYAEENGK
ncbi:MAG: hypothetical protein NVSMB1_01860 [Polyangiales bacterium]